MKKESDIEKMERLKDRIIIYCNKCYRQLTEKERHHYSIEHQFSGEMYCDEHRTNLAEEGVKKEREVRKMKLTVRDKKTGKLHRVAKINFDTKQISVPSSLADVDYDVFWFEDVEPFLPEDHHNPCTECGGSGKVGEEG